MRIVSKDDRELVEVLAQLAVDHPKVFLRIFGEIAPPKFIIAVAANVLAEELAKKPRKRKARK